MESGASIAVDGFLHLLVSQVATRLATFLLNLLSTRSLTPDAYGVAAVQFHLINTSILFVSREGFRRGCLRVSPHDLHATRKVLGVAWITLPLGALLSAAVTLGLLAWQTKPDHAYRSALLMQGCAAFLELCSEPLYILASVRLLFGLRAALETGATLAKGGLLLALLRSGHLPAPMAFSWAQLAYAGVLLCGYVAYFLPAALTALRQQQRAGAGHGTQGQQHEGSWAPDHQILRVSATLTLQAVEKLFLAEGSKLMVAAVQSTYAQGVYGLVTNLGSLVVRTLFQPFEEAAFVAFSKDAAVAGPSPSPAQLAQQCRLLSLLVRAITTLALLAAAFGPAYSYLALLLAYGRRWADTEAAAALGLYSAYLVLLAGNGILEAFVHAVAGPAQLRRINLWLVAFSAVHLAASLVAARAGGAAALVLADGANMAVRVAYCLAFLAARFACVRGFALRGLLPAGGTLVALGSAAVLTCASRLVLLPESAGLWAWWRAVVGGGSGAPPAWLLAVVGRLPLHVRMALHVLLGCGCLAVVGAALYLQERDVLRQLRQVRRSRDQAEQKQE